MSRTGTALVLAAAVVVGGACGDDSGDTDTTSDHDENRQDTREAAVDWPGDGSETEAVDLGQGLVAELPASWEVEPFEEMEQGAGTDQSCEGPRAGVDPGEEAPSLELALHPVDCGSDEQIINGFHGTYTSLDEVPEPREVEEHEVAAGSLTTFTQTYEEYTNERNVYEDHVGLLELDTPPDPEHPTLMILDAKGDYAMADLGALAEAIDTTS